MSSKRQTRSGTRMVNARKMEEMKERENREGHGDSSRKPRGAGRTQRPSPGISADAIVASCRSRTSLQASSSTGGQTREPRRSSRIGKKDYRTQYFEVFEDGVVEVVRCTVATSNPSSRIYAFNRRRQRLGDGILKDCTNSPAQKVERSEAPRSGVTTVQRSEDNGGLRKASTRRQSVWDLPCWGTTKHRRSQRGQRKFCTKALHLFPESRALKQKGPQATSRRHRGDSINGKKRSDGSQRAANKVSTTISRRIASRTTVALKRAQALVEMTVVDPNDQFWGPPTGVPGMLRLNESLAVSSLTGKTTQVQEDGVLWYKHVACQKMLEFVERSARIQNHSSIEGDQVQRLATQEPTTESIAPFHDGTNVTKPSQATFIQTAAFNSCYSDGLTKDLETLPNHSRNAMEATCNTSAAQEAMCRTVEVNKPARRLSAVRSLMRMKATIAGDDCDDEEEIDCNEFPLRAKRKKHRPKVKRDESKPRKRRGPKSKAEKGGLPANGLQDVVEQCIQFIKIFDELQHGHQAFEASSIPYDHIERQQGCREISHAIENTSRLHSSTADVLMLCADRAISSNDGAATCSQLSFFTPDEESSRGAFLQQTKGLNLSWEGQYDKPQNYLTRDALGNQQGGVGKPFLHDFFAPSQSCKRPVLADLNKAIEGHELTLYTQCPDQWEAPQSPKSIMPQNLVACSAAVPQCALTHGNSTALTLAQGKTQPGEELQVVLYNQKRDIVLSQVRKRPKKLRAKINVDPESLREWHLLENGELPQEHEDPKRKKGWDNERAAMASRVDAFIKTMHEVQGDRRFSHWKGSIVDSVVGAFLTQNVSDHLSSSAFMSIAARFPIVPRTGIIEAPLAETHKSSCDLQNNTKGLSFLTGKSSSLTPREQVTEMNTAVNINMQIQDADSTNVEADYSNFMDPSDFAHSSQHPSSEACDYGRNSLTPVEACSNLSNTPNLPFLQIEGASANATVDQCDFIDIGKAVRSIRQLNSLCYYGEEGKSCAETKGCPNISLNKPETHLLKNKGTSTEVENGLCGFMNPCRPANTDQSDHFCDDERNCHTVNEECNLDSLNIPDRLLRENERPGTTTADGNCNHMHLPSFQLCNDGRISVTANKDFTHACLDASNYALLKNEGPAKKVVDSHCGFLDPFETVDCSQVPSSHLFNDERDSGTDVEDCAHALHDTLDMPLPKWPNVMASDDERNSSISVEHDLGADTATPRMSWGSFGSRFTMHSRSKVSRKLNFETKAVTGNEEHQTAPGLESICEAKSPHNHVVEEGLHVLVERQFESQEGMALSKISKSGHILDLQVETVQESSQDSNFQVNAIQATDPFLVPKTRKKRPLSVSSVSGPERAQLEANQKGRKKNHHQDWESVRRQVLEDQNTIGKDSGIPQAGIYKEKDSVNWDAVRLADLGVLADTIKERGMHHVLSGRIKAFLTTLYEEHGSINLEWIRDLSPEKAREYLMSIHGLGVKSVECIRLLTLHHLAFPVDTNVGRICVRLGWVPIEPLPEELQLHLLELYPVQESIQKYLWPRLCTLNQETLYELHYQLITFGKVFCTKSKPNCNACPMRQDCKHFASAFASAKPLLTGPTYGTTGRICTNQAIEALPAASIDRKELNLIDYPQANIKNLSFAEGIVHVTEIEVNRTYPLSCCNSTQALDRTKQNSECIIEEPASPEPVHADEIMDIEEFGGKETYIYDKLSDYSKELLAESLHCRFLSDQESSSNHDIKIDDSQLGPLNSTPFLASLSNKELSCCPSQYSDLGERASCKSQIVVTSPIPSIGCQCAVSGTMPGQPSSCSEITTEVTSNAIVSLPPEAAQIPVPKLKNVGRLRTVHFVYELPDNHPLLVQMGMDTREQDDPCYYLLAIWSPGEIPESQQEIDDLCREGTHTSACGSTWGADENVSGTLLIPCRTAMHGSFPLNGTYFQVNEVFADHESSQHPIQVPRHLIWNLRRRFVYFSTSVPNIFRGLSTSEIRNCFWLGYVCVRGFDRETRAPKPLVCRLHFPISKQQKPKKRAGKEV